MAENVIVRSDVVNENVVVSSNNGETEVWIEPFKLQVRFDEEKLEIVFGGAKNNTVAIKGNTKFLFEGNTHLMCGGEFSINTQGNNIYLDSLDGKIQLNSRLAKPIKDLPESLAYRQKQQEKTNAHRLLAKKEKVKHRIISDLDRRLSILEEKLARCSCVGSQG